MSNVLTSSFDFGVFSHSFLSQPLKKLRC